MAALTLLGNLSPITLISGPVVLIRTGLRILASVILENSPIASADISRMFADPFIRPYNIMFKSGSRALGMVNNGSKNSPVAKRILPTPIHLVMII
jgi:hypothetical protein